MLKVGIFLLLIIVGLTGSMIFFELTRAGKELSAKDKVEDAKSANRVKDSEELAEKLTNR